jgi:hypothetical protein
MILQCCSRCGDVEAVEDHRARERVVECAGEELVLCAPCFQELRSWFYDLSPELAPADAAS